MPTNLEEEIIYPPPYSVIEETPVSAVAVDEIINEHREGGRVRRWPINSELEQSPSVVYRNEFIKRLAQKNVPEILQAYVYFSVSEMRQMMGLATRYLLPEPFHGVGLDLGAGSGLLASVVASRQSVKAVLAVEICAQASELLIPKVASWVLGENAKKVVPVVGSFDDLQLPDESVDFIVEIDSFHHSDNLPQTFSECARVLRPGGWLLCFDRCWPDTHPDSDLERLLSLIYSAEYLKAHGFPIDMVMTRRENGEHEYKLREWRDAFDAAGLTLFRMCKCLQRVTHRRGLKGLMSLLPRPITRLLYGTENATLLTTRSWLSQQLATAALALDGRESVAVPQRWPQSNLFAPRETSMILLRKPPL